MCIPAPGESIHSKSSQRGFNFLPIHPALAGLAHRKERVSSEYKLPSFLAGCSVLLGLQHRMDLL